MLHVVFRQVTHFKSADSIPAVRGTIVRSNAVSPMRSSTIAATSSNSNSNSNGGKKKAVNSRVSYPGNLTMRSKQISAQIEAAIAATSHLKFEKLEI